MYLNDFSKYLFINNQINTGLSITIEKPTTIKFLKIEKNPNVYTNCFILK